MVLLAALEVLLMRWSGEEDFAVGTAGAGRGQPGLEGIIGQFTNYLVLRSDLPQRTDFSSLLAAVRETALEAHAHHALPFSVLVEEVGAETGRSYWPLFQVVFGFNNLPPPAIDGDDLELESIPVPIRIERYGLSFLLQQAGGEIGGVVRASSDLYDRATLDRLARAYRALVQALVDAPDAPFHALPLATVEERDQVLFTAARDDRGLPRRRGFPVDPARVGRELSRLPGVRRARASLADGRLIARYETAGPGQPAPERVLEELAFRLPHFLLPDECRAVASLEMRPDGTPGEPAAAFAGDVEARLRDLWGDLLAGSSPGERDDFFACGGSSLSALLLARRIADEWGVEVAPDLVFHRRTPAAQAQTIRALLGAAAGAGRPETAEVFR
jgi:hypothetical protein